MAESIQLPSCAVGFDNPNFTLGMILFSND